MTRILSNLNRSDLRFFFTGRFLGKFAVKRILKIPPHLAYDAISPCEKLMWAKQAINHKLQGSVVTYLRCGGLLITKLRKVYCWVCDWKKFKIGKYFVSYKQELDCFVHFLRLLAVFWPSAQSARKNHVLACNFAKYSPILIFFTHRLSNKPFLIWLSTTRPHLKHVATLPCSLSLMAYFADINVHKVV